MNKEILDIVKDFSLWNGNSFTLAQLVAEKQKEISRAALIDAGFTEAAEVF